MNPLFNQYGGGGCTMCGSPNTNRRTCPLNPEAQNKNALTHPLAHKSGKASKAVKKAPAAPKATKKVVKKNPREHEVVFKIKYERSNDETAERDPTPAELERYIAASHVIPENVDYLDELILTSPVVYIGKRQFRFTCETDIASRQEIANLFLLQSLDDGEWGAAPGNGGFVYPTGDGEEELGLLSFESVKVDGKVF